MKFERYAIIYGEDAPMPPSLKTLEISRKGMFLWAENGKIVY